SDGTERVVTYGLILLRRHERSSGGFGNIDQRLKRIRCRRIAEAQYLHRADEFFAVNQRNVVDGANGSPRINVGVIFALKLRRSFADHLGVVMEQTANQAGIRWNCLVVDGGVADDRAQHPVTFVRLGGSGVNAGGCVGNQFGGKTCEDASPRGYFLRLNQILKKRSDTTT